MLLHSELALCSNYSIDATQSQGLGRLCNDEHRTPNSIMRKVVDENHVHLCLFALEAIHCDEEIRYDYGPDNGTMYWRQVHC